MALTNFYIDSGSGGSDLNAGTTTGAFAFNYAGGTFVRATGVFTVASGNPLTDGVTVGTYASVYTTAGATGATFVAQITARDATTITVDVTTLKWGLATAVSETAAATTLKVSGSWISEIPLATLGNFTIAAATKVNIKSATYTVTASRSCTIAGTALLPMWIDGYNATPGDLDNDTTNTLTKPTLALNATFQITAQQVHQLWSNLIITGNVSNAVFAANAGPTRLLRCRITNTSTNASAYAVNMASNSGGLFYCYCKGSSTGGTAVGVVNNLAGNCVLIGTVAEGGAFACFNIANSTLATFHNCVAINGTAGFLASTGSVKMFGCTVYNMSSDGVKFSGLPSPSHITGNLFSTIGGIGINNASGTNNINSLLACNDYYSCSGGNTVGFGDMPEFFVQTESADPLTSATNLTPKSTSNAKDHGFPGIFENQTYSSFVDIGAVEPSSAGAAVAIFGG